MFPRPIKLQPFQGFRELNIAGDQENENHREHVDNKQERIFEWIATTRRPDDLRVEFGGSLC